MKGNSILGALFATLLATLHATVLATTNANAADADDTALQCFALNLYHEARSEGREGMVAVGWVVLNRMRSERYPDTVCGVIRQGGERPPCRFNWWRDGKSDRPTERGAWRQAQLIAEEMLSNPPADPTNGAIWFHLDSLEPAAWLAARERTTILGRHYFYR